MPIVTDRTITIHGVSVGISKPIQTLIANGDFTYAELSKYAIVGRHDFVNNKAGVFAPDTYSYMAGTSAAIAELEKYPVLNSPTAPGWDSVLYTYFGSGKRSYDNYGKMVLVYNMTHSTNIIERDFNDNNDACIVTDINPRLLKMLCNIYTGTVNATVGDTGTYTIYEPETSRSFVWMDDDTSAPFASMCIQNFDDAYYFDFPLYNNMFNASQSISGNRDSTYVSLANIVDDYMLTGGKLLSVWCDGGIDDFLQGANYGAEFVGANDMSDERGDKIVYTHYIPYGATINTRAISLDTALKQCASCGFYFEYDDTVYKPITDGGIVTGYTAQLDRNSEWDLINNVTGNTVPDAPGGGGSDDGDDIDDHKMGAGSQLSGIAQLWVLTRAQLIALHAAFANAPVNYDPMSSFISVMGVGISVLRVVGDSMPWTLNPINIKMSNGETWYTGVEGHIVDKQVSAFNEINIRVKRKYNNFLDYSPYATHEIFLPMCGWLTLPDIAVDRGITVTYIPDIETLKVRAVVSVVDNEGNRCVIGEKDGVMGAEIPFTNIGHSLFLGNTVVQSADIAGEIVTGAIGAGFTKTNAQGGKFRPYEGFTVGMAGTLPGAIGNALVSGNVNRTHFTTGNGSRIGFGDGENIQIKSTYHRIDKPNNYDHTVGKVCNKTGKLSEFTGFTVCDNPHINFSATEREKEEINQLLEQGVIL